MSPDLIPPAPIAGRLKPLADLKRTRRSLVRLPVLRVLKQMRCGYLTLRLPEGDVLVFGGAKPGPVARVEVRRESFFTRCALHGGVGLGESYVAGDWDTTDMRMVIEWFIQNIRDQPRWRNSSQRFRGVGWLRLLDRTVHRLRPNSRRQSRRNIAAHYDLGNEFYRLWLDDTMTYSAAKFSSPKQSLESAQVEKYDALCRKLRLRGGDHLLEIGCGWGGFSIHAASRYRCRVTAVTISQEQYDEATRRVAEAGLCDLVEIRLQDYREIEGKFDKIASIEMLEAVGEKYLETYFAKCHELLRRDGLLALQVITVPDRAFAEIRRGTDFIQKHIFPGSLLPSVARVNRAVNRTGDLFLCGLEDMGSGYARTLREWHQRFNSQLEAVRAQGFSQAFIRKWNYYLKYCEAAFATRNISVVQAVYTRPGNQHSLHSCSGVDTP